MKRTLSVWLGLGLVWLTACIQPTSPPWENPADDRDQDGVPASADCDDFDPKLGTGVCPRCGDGIHTGPGCDVCVDVQMAGGACDQFLGMVLIPAGTFWMGCNAANDSNCSSDESPQHKVTLSAYYMDVTETTVAQYQACVDAGVCTAPSTGSQATYPSLPNHPVTYVTWTQSQAYCKWRGAAFDLPTEAQWEMAARGSCEKNGSSASDPACAAAMRRRGWC